METLAIVTTASAGLERTCFSILDVKTPLCKALVYWQQMHCLK